MTPLEMIAEWRKGCTNGTKEHPEECHECTLELINCLESKLKKNEKRIIERERK